MFKKSLYVPQAQKYVLDCIIERGGIEANTKTYSEIATRLGYTSSTVNMCISWLYQNGLIRKSKMILPNIDKTRN